jgi:hypothetical protein
MDILIVLAYLDQDSIKNQMSFLIAEGRSPNRSKDFYADLEISLSLQIWLSDAILGAIKSI